MPQKHIDWLCNLLGHVQADYGVRMKFEVTKTAGKARFGRLDLGLGQDVETPAFMPVASGAAAKSISMGDIEAIGYRLILGNVYHMMERPGLEVIEKLGGLKKFSGWSRGWLTDSGGYQVFSLEKFRKVDNDGVTFRSVLDGASHRLTPESVISAQEELGSDILMCLDVCPPAGAMGEELSSAVEKTLSWARRSRQAWHENKGALFGILQGGTDLQQREICAKGLIDLDFPGYALGGISVGEGTEALRQAVSIGSELLPVAKPRYLMGVGSPGEMLFAIEHGVDLFDCVVPTRHARHGQAYTRTGVLRLRGRQNQLVEKPLDDMCICPVCQRHSRGYLRHLVMTSNPTGGLLLTRHNLQYFFDLMKACREAIVKNGNLEDVYTEYGIEKS